MICVPAIFHPGIPAAEESDWDSLESPLEKAGTALISPVLMGAAHLQLSLNCLMMLLIFSNLCTSRCSLH